MKDLKRTTVAERSLLSRAAQILDGRAVEAGQNAEEATSGGEGASKEVAGSRKRQAEGGPVAEGMESTVEALSALDQPTMQRVVQSAML